MIPRAIVTGCLAGFVCAGILSGAGAGESPPAAIARFSLAQPGAEPPAPWMAQRFRAVERATAYTLESDAGATVVRADSASAASGLIHPLQVPLADSAGPTLAWRWKTARLLPGSDVQSKRADDSVARVYVTFRFEPDRRSTFERMESRIAQALYGKELPHATLIYLWDRTLPAGTILPSPHTHHVKVIVVESGEAKLGGWSRHERQVADDFRRAFGEGHAVMTGVAIMTDTDDTGGTATTWYGDIELRTRTAP